MKKLSNGSMVSMRKSIRKKTISQFHGCDYLMGKTTSSCTTKTTYLEPKPYWEEREYHVAKD